MNTKTIHIVYTDDAFLLKGVEKARAQGFIIGEVYSPFPVHGLDQALRLKKSRLSIAAFVYGSLGLLVAAWFTYYTMIVDWPQNFGGKPNATFWLNSPSFVPTLFEFTIFFAAHLLVLTFLWRSKLFPFKKADNPNPRTTSDQFLLEIEVPTTALIQVESLFAETHPLHIAIIEENTDE